MLTVFIVLQSGFVEWMESHWSAAKSWMGSLRDSSSWATYHAL